MQLKLLLWSGLELSSDNCNHRSAVMKFIIANQYRLTTHRAASEVLDLDWEIKTAVGLLQFKSTCNCGVWLGLIKRGGSQLCEDMQGSTVSHMDMEMTV